MPTQKIDPKVIFASDAPAIDKPPVFSDKTKGWDVARANDGRPEIKQMNKMQQDTDLKILWLNENAVLPYDASIDYPDGAVALKDGSFKQLSGGSWIEFLDDFADKDAVKRGIANRYDSSLTYNSGERITLANGDIVKSTIDGNTNDPNVNMIGWLETDSAKLNVRRYGAKGLFNVTTRTGTAETAAFKNYIADQQANAWGSIDLAADIHDYLIDETLVFDKTVTIFGGSGSTYNQPEQPKKGSVVLANGLALGFDLGANRPAPPLNFADMWCVKDLMVQPQTMKSKTQTAFAITGANDAPDRGINFVGVSAMGFEKCVYLPDHGTLTQGATMNFDGCVMSHNANVIVADNCVYGLRVVNCQMEANTESVIKGKFNASVTIEDCMLEGNVNCIDLQSGTRVAFQSQVTIGGVYLEWNKGDFVARIQGVAAWDDLYPTVTINPNFAYEIDAPDYMIFKDRLHVKYNDVTHVATMANGFDGVYGSYLTNSHKNKIKARKGSDGKFSSSIAQNPSDISSLREPTGFSTVTVERTDKAYINLNGESYTYLNEYDEFHPVSGMFNAGDVVEIHAIFCDVGRMRTNGTEEIRTHFGFGGYFAGGVKAFEVNSVGVTKSNGDVAVVSGICTVETTITNPIFRWYCLENENLSGKFLGFAYKNHGAIADDTLLITPFVPTLIPYNPNRYKAVHTLSIDGNSSTYVEISLPNAKYGDMVLTSITPVDNPSHVITSNGYVNDSNKVIVRIFNNYSTAIVNAQFWVNAEVIK
ncbi:MAG: hypothetical protein RSE38_04360 [Acinetobacter sp.]